MTRLDATPSELLRAAQEGDEQAFAALLEPHRRELHALCYRMLGSVDDADDLVQDVLVRAWRGLAGFEGRSALRTWLVRLATNACLNQIERRPARTLPLDRGPAAATGEGPGDRILDPIWIGPYPDRFLGDDETSRPDAIVEQRESVELAFVAALHHLNARSRAVLLLRLVLGFSAEETANLLDTSVAGVNSALQRARAAIEKRLPAQSQQATLRALGDSQLRELVQRYMLALETGDVAALLDLLTDDATWSMPPMPRWYQGKAAIAGFVENFALRSRWRHLTTHANGQPAVGCYRWDDQQGAFVAHVLDVLTIGEHGIAAVTGFVDADAPILCGLPRLHPETDPARARPADGG